MFATSYDKIELNLLELFGSTKRDVDLCHLRRSVVLISLSISIARVHAYSHDALSTYMIIYSHYFPFIRAFIRIQS